MLTHDESLLLYALQTADNCYNNNMDSTRIASEADMKGPKTSRDLAEDYMKMWGFSLDGKELTHLTLRAHLGVTRTPPTTEEVQKYVQDYQRFVADQTNRSRPVHREHLRRPLHLQQRIAVRPLQLRRPV